jgi:glucan phosphoethanolaminetransferase (alkaline phosphatase superfamily)
MMSISRMFKYLAYAVVLFGFLFIADSILLWAAHMDWLRNPIFYLIQILFGVLLGLESLIMQFRQDGHWHINAEKAIFLGLPPLALLAFFLLYYGRVINVSPGNILFRNYGMQIGMLQIYAGVVLGYALATVFQK